MRAAALSMTNDEGQLCAWFARNIRRSGKRCNFTMSAGQRYNLIETRVIDLRNCALERQFLSLLADNRIFRILIREFEYSNAIKTRIFRLSYKNKEAELSIEPSLIQCFQILECVPPIDQRSLPFLCYFGSKHWKRLQKILQTTQFPNKFHIEQATTAKYQ